ncbi:acyltransferase family protein [Glacieibacterium megasporae]|uniref:acyltransferase family protein n=1 Tax=Glacieibacterium megasporae TaxID=2835787 RepID=UPI001C1DF49B|nr:acyltransferase [Polymorphobacter megasporae]UAJ10101.1 acyltransferase [Polymorphobacter megasporae]
MAIERQSFGSIQAGRGVAALLVVLFHASAKVFAKSDYWDTTILGGFFNFGHAGVDFFFVLSGFIIAHVHAADIGAPARLSNFVRSRLLRIYPVYWFILIGVIALSLLPFGLNSSVHLTPQMVISAFVLVGPVDSPTVLAVAWTLFHEIAFYIAFGIAIASPRAGIVVAGAWVAGILASALGYPFLLPYLGDSINLLFLFGVGTWWLSKHHPRTLPVVLAWVGTAGFLALGMENVFAPVFSYAARHLLFGAASAIIIGALVAQEGRRPIKVSPVLLTLGAASYSIYLTHFPVLGFVAKTHAIAAVRALPVALAFVLVVALTVLAGVAFHFLVEKPLTRATGRWWPRGGARSGSGATPLGRP